MAQIFRPNTLRLALTWGVVLAVTLLPVLRVAIPPGADMPAHLARLFAHRNLARDADLRDFYEVNWEILPNLGFDLPMLALMQVLPPYAAGRVFIIIAMLLPFVGVAMLRHQVHGRVGAMPMLGALFAYNAIVAVGLASYHLGIGLILIATALWLMTRELSTLARLGVASGVAVLLFFTHLFALGVYGLVLALMRLGTLTRQRRLDARQDIPLIGQFVIPAVLWLLVPPPSHGTEFFHGPLSVRLEAIVSPVFYFKHFDYAFAACLFILVVWLLASRRLTINGPLAPPVIGLAAFGLVMPTAAAGIWLLHYRLPVVAVLLLIAAARVDIPERALRALLIMTLVFFGLVKLHKVDREIQICEAWRQDFITALSEMPRGARILPVVEETPTPTVCMPVNGYHLSALAVIERSAFTPLMPVSVWPLNLRPAYRHLAQGKPLPASPKILSGDLGTFGEPDWNRVIAARWRTEFDYLVWLHPGALPSRVPSGVTRVTGGDVFTLYRIP